MSVNLRVDWCNYEAAKFAVEHWHYSRSMPGGKRVMMGVWEDARFVGAVVYGLGANRNIGAPYGLRQFEVAELVRVALAVHLSPVSKIVSVSVKRLRQQSPGLRLLVSYADPAQEHHGGIYQAMNWVYVGQTDPVGVIRVGRELLHKKTAYSRYGHNNAAQIGGEWVQTDGKHKYLYPLDRAMRKQIASLAKPYPKRESCGQSVEGDTVGNQSTGAGSIPAGRSV